MTEVTEKKEPAQEPQPPQPAQAQQAAATEGGKKAPKGKGEEPKKGETKTAQAPERNTRPEAAPTTKGGGGAAITVATIALLIAAAASIAGYSLWQQLNQKQSALEGRISGEEQTLASLQSLSQTAQQSSQSLQQQFATFDERLNELKQHDSRLDESLSSLKQRLELRRGNDWLVAEARHLIHIASYQAQLNHNPQSAIAALETADQRLLAADEPSLLKARQALSSDIAALRAIPSVDVAGISLLLSELEQQVATLPLAGMMPNEAGDDSEAAPPEGESSGVGRFFRKVWNDLKGLVTIRHDNAADGSPLTTPDQRIYLQQNLRLKLEVARLALLQRDTQTFRAAITTIRQWLESYYDTQAAATAAMLTSLAPFATLELQPPLPDVDNALRALDAWQEQQKGKTRVEAPLKREAVTS